MIQSGFTDISMIASAQPLLESFSALSDATRCRTLFILERQELTVSELCAVLQLPQSTVSRHLKTLADAGLVVSRRDGTSRYYSPAPDDHGAQARIWEVTRSALAGSPSAAVDLRRLDRVLARRGETSQQFFASAAGQWDRLRAELFGADFALGALVGLVPDAWVVGDLGCGTGVTAAALAPYVARVIGVDGSAEMLAAAASRLGRFENVELRRGTLEALPIDDAALDAALMMLVLHHLPSPAEALAEAARVIKPGGRILLVDMLPHEHEEYRRQMGHVWLGFAEDQMRRLLETAGFVQTAVHGMAPAAGAKGPALFAATAATPQDQRRSPQ
jgi:ubiquinone/menaquinone biosynthesis C-methylase UbiE/DNA-binding transcriptional ArsR family regulator